MQWPSGIVEVIEKFMASSVFFLYANNSYYFFLMWWKIGINNIKLFGSEEINYER